MTVSVAKSGPQAEQNRIEQLLLHIIVKKVSFMVGIFQFLIKLPYLCAFLHMRRSKKPLVLCDDL